MADIIILHIKTIKRHNSFLCRQILKKNWASFGQVYVMAFHTSEYFILHVSCCKTPIFLNGDALFCFYISKTIHFITQDVNQLIFFEWLNFDHFFWRHLFNHNIKKKKLLQTQHRLLLYNFSYQWGHIFQGVKRAIENKIVRVYWKNILSSIT